jgi:hypothetical protein
VIRILRWAIVASTAVVAATVALVVFGPHGAHSVDFSGLAYLALGAAALVVVWAAAAVAAIVTSWRELKRDAR